MTDKKNSELIVLINKIIKKKFHINYRGKEEKMYKKKLYANEFKNVYCTESIKVKLMLNFKLLSL